MTAARTAFRSALPLLLTIVATPLWASTVLTFDVTSHNEPAKGAKQTVGVPPTDAHYVMTVTLAGDSLQVGRPDQRTVYDFARRRYFSLDEPKRRYAEGSLYERIGFDDAEFANRMMLGKALAAGEVKDNPMAPALTEHLMSLSDPANATVIDTRTVGTDTVYSWDKRPLMTLSKKTRDLPVAAMSQYLRFLRYEVGGHPKILDAIYQGGGVPERLTIVRSNIATETRTLILQNIADAPDPALSLEGYTREMPTGEPYTILKGLSSNPAADLEARVTTHRKDRDAALAANHPLEAFLANMASVLSAGDQDEATTWLSQHHDQIGSDPGFQRVMQSLMPRDKASARQAADTFEALKQPASAHGYVLDIFQANTQTSLHQGDKAIELFLAALRTDPTITGAWIDLGGVYYRNFDAGAAWACWDAARALRPTHYLLKTVDEREQKLRKDHPEFF